MTDDPQDQLPTPEDKAAAKAVLDDPDYLAEPDDPRDDETIDAPLTEGD